MDDKIRKLFFLKSLTAGDIILMTMLIFLGITSLFVINKVRQPGEMCSIEVSGEILHHLKLSENQNISVEGPVGKTLIRIKDNKVRVTYSDCPEKICEKTGWISNVGEIIVCVPNKVIITIDGEIHDYFNVITQ